jgi:hypothetical protein
MTERIKARLEELRQEYAAGMAALADIQKRQEELRTNVLRISGAIQVLEELLAAQDEAKQDGAKKDAPEIG